MDAMNLVFLVAFLAGIGFAAVSFLLGGGDNSGADTGTDGFDAGHADAGGVDGGHTDVGNTDVGHTDVGSTDGGAEASGHHSALVVHGAGHFGLSAMVAPLLSLYAASAFCGLGGGAGLVARLAGGGALLSLLVALPAGLIGAYLAGGFMTWLKRSSRYERPFETLGTVATVIAPCSVQHVGEILFTRDGKRCSLPARGRSEQRIENGTEVIVVALNDGVATVAPSSEALEDTREVR
jgi:hypothetical protein